MQFCFCGCIDLQTLYFNSKRQITNVGFLFVCLQVSQTVFISPCHFFIQYKYLKIHTINNHICIISVTIRIVVIFLSIMLSEWILIVFQRIPYHIKNWRNTGRDNYVNVRFDRIFLKPLLTGLFCVTITITQEISSEILRLKWNLLLPPSHHK